MKHSHGGTIAAIATPLGSGGVGVIRVSGKRAQSTLTSLFLSSNGKKVESHRMLHGWIIDPLSNEKIDEVMACLMLSPKSYTGEDVVEFYCHGGMAIVQKVLSLTLDSGSRLAKRGEFTKRAFLNGKLDLVQAEAILDLVNTQSFKGAGLAVRQLEGKLSLLVQGIRQKLIALLSEFEVGIDFPDDGPDMDYDAVLRKINAYIKEINIMLGDTKLGRIYRQGMVVVIVGKPNVGKSSLLNALLGEERAIVTNIPGTTRDSIEESIDINGLPLRLIDTAGLRKAKGKAERCGVIRTEYEIDAADLVLIVIDASNPLDKQDKLILEKTKDKQRIVVLNKVDLRCRLKIKGYKTSALTGQGIGELKQGILSVISDGIGMAGKDSVAINERHVECLKRAETALKRVEEGCKNRDYVDAVCLDLKEAIVSMGEVTGETVSEEVINSIFEKFCVGK